MRDRNWGGVTSASRFWAVRGRAPGLGRLVLIKNLVTVSEPQGMINVFSLLPVAVKHSTTTFELW